MWQLRDGPFFFSILSEAWQQLETNRIFFFPSLPQWSLIQIGAEQICFPASSSLQLHVDVCKPHLPQSAPSTLVLSTGLKSLNLDLQNQTSPIMYPLLPQMSLIITVPPAEPSKLETSPSYLLAPHEHPLCSLSYHFVIMVLHKVDLSRTYSRSTGHLAIFHLLGKYIS